MDALSFQNSDVDFVSPQSGHLFVDMGETLPSRPRQRTLFDYQKKAFSRLTECPFWGLLSAFLNVCPDKVFCVLFQYFVYFVQN
ncbi:hypothetical protein SAMN04489713_109327 [Actinomadura madurae]|uniref:Uncharacterized protein n=1 Tax=Actinomadura madurae TaxID=1993 RepID=A0A1I5K2Y4_9ACTN|nr:hypothetical protein SAMN04489713_109327 [Actinomadura madurae]SPT56742.1 Uncharacterised protein [Actinomadura madurae]